ncbi:MAG: hypothetical protein ACKPKO_29525, partial [Candidatus Fonsibacter sp.]
MIDLADTPLSDIPFVVHNTQITNVTSINKRCLMPGGGGITSAVHSQLSAFHLMDDRLQDSSRARTSDAITFYKVEEVKKLLAVAMSGVLVTRKTLPSTMIEKIWIRRTVQLMDAQGKRAPIRVWVTMMDTRVRG